MVKKFKKGDKVKIVNKFEGYGAYGIKKGSVGTIVKKSTYRGRQAHQIEFPKAGKELSLHPEEIRKVKRR